MPRVGLGVADGAQTGGAADLDVGHGVTDEDALRGRVGRGCRGHGAPSRGAASSARAGRDAADDGVDQGSEVVVIEECLDRSSRIGRGIRLFYGPVGLRLLTVAPPSPSSIAVPARP